MMTSSDDCEREAALYEEAARYVTLLPAREELLAHAQSLRERADGAAKSDANAPVIGDTFSGPREPPHPAFWAAQLLGRWIA